MLRKRECDWSFELLELVAVVGCIVFLVALAPADLNHFLLKLYLTASVWLTFNLEKFNKKKKSFPFPAKKKIDKNLSTLCAYWESSHVVSCYYFFFFCNDII